MTYFDSSVLVSAVAIDEPHHAACFAELAANGPKFTSSHALAETYSTLTGGKSPTRLRPNEAKNLIRASITPRLSIEPLPVDAYLNAFDLAEGVGARGGAIYDLLHLQVARALNAERILTLNYNHFVQFAPDLASRVRVPKLPE